MTTAEADDTGSERFPFATISLLGLVTIAAYGTWYYSFGVLLDPILDDTGWPERWVTGSFAASAAVGGLLAPIAGRLLDRFGSRRLFLAATALNAAGLLAASAADSLWLFFPASVVGGASLSAFGFYHVTQATAVRVSPAAPTRAIALLTIWGAFASFVYLPLAAALVEATDWRVTIRVLVAITSVVLLTAAAFVRERTPPDRTQTSPDWRALLAEPRVRRYALATAGIGAAAGIILVYQVPLMVDAGLALGTASWLAGARGLAQLGGRLPLTSIVERFGSRGGLQVAFGAITIGAALLAGSGTVVIAALFVIVAGFGIGATSPLQGIYANELFPAAQLGSSMGGISLIFGLSGAIGPAVVGVLADITGSRWWGVGIAVAAAGAATLLMSDPSRAAAPRTSRRNVQN